MPCTHPLPPLAVALGDPAGIGPEIVTKAWEVRVEKHLPRFFAIGDLRSLRAVWDGPVEILSAPGDAAAVFNLGGARCALDSLEIAVGLARAGTACGVVTGPVSKAQLYAIGFTHPGQTEFIAERCGISSCNTVMMLAGPSLRAVPVTIHTALADVPGQLTTELIVTRARVTARGLQRDFGIAEPRLAVAGLNPHAGESGTLGREEIELIAPAIEQLRAEGIDIAGPLSADTMFHARARARYDAAICMYHDQALIPLKTLHFDDGVNITLGLPIVRTSPDHGTAFDIAGHGIAQPDAMIAAICMAGECATRRANG